MSTGINIKKKISVEEESVVITNDVNSINFVGSGVTASAVGDDVTVTVPGATGATVYYINESVAVGSYKQFSSVSTGGPEVTTTQSAGPGLSVDWGYETDLGVPNTTVIPAGLWQFFVHFSGTGTWDLYVEVYKIDLLSVETLLFTTDAVSTTLTGSAVMYITDGVFPLTSLLTTDRLVVKVVALNTDVAINNVTFYTEGSTHYSVGTTTLNQAIPVGGVTSVTGIAPVVSSGGTTPAISMAQANGSTDGYLSSVDWTTFNNKLSQAYQTVEDEGVAVTQRSTINFVGSNVSVADSGGKTVVTVSGSTTGRFGIADSTGTYTYYTTLTLAMAAAVSGQTVEFFTDYTESGAVTVTLKDGVTINGNGHTYSHSGAATALKINTNGTYAILNLNLTKTGGTNAAILTTPDAFPGQPALSTSTNLSGTTIKTDYLGIYCSLYDVNEFYFGKVVVTGGSTYGLYGPSTNFSHFSVEGLAASSGTLAFGTQLNHCYIVNRGSGLTISDLAINNSEVISYSSQAAGGIYNARNCFFYSATGIALQPYNNGVVDNCMMYSGASFASGLYNSNATYHNCRFQSAASNAFFASLTGDVRFNNCVFMSNGATAFEGYASVLSNCVIESTYALATGHALKVTHGGLVLKNCTLRVANSSANCLYATSALSPSYTSNIFQGATTPVNANVTQAIVNTEDAYGNLTI